jgi:hypothetical protein
MTRKARTWGAWLRRWTWRGVLWLVLVPGWLLTAAVLLSSIGVESRVVTSWCRFGAFTQVPQAYITTGEYDRFDSASFGMRTWDGAFATEVSSAYAGGALSAEQTWPSPAVWRRGLDAPLRIRSGSGYGLRSLSHGFVLDSGGWLPLRVFLGGPAIVLIVVVAVSCLRGGRTAVRGWLARLRGFLTSRRALRRVRRAALACALLLACLSLFSALGGEVDVRVSLLPESPFFASREDAPRTAWAEPRFAARDGGCDFDIVVVDFQDVPRRGFAPTATPKPQRGFFDMPHIDPKPILFMSFWDTATRLRIGGWVPCSIALVWLLVIAVIRFRRWRRRRLADGPLCDACGYNLTGNVTGRCPECGAAITPADVS